MKTSSAILCSLAVLTGMHGPGTVSAQDPAEPTLIELGRKIFFDVNLSVNRKQSCASCHDPATGFTGPDAAINAAGAVEEGAIPGRFGNRKPPSSAYVGEVTGEAAVLGYDEVAKTWFGGLFWDGRATGTVLGDPVAEQAMGPFLNPLEMAMPNARQVVLRVAQAEYAQDFETVWGPGSLDFTQDVEGSYERIVRTIAAYERSPEVNPYSSKFDRFYDKAKAAGKDIKLITTMGLNNSGTGPWKNNPMHWSYYLGLDLTDYELKGLAVFNDAQRMGGDCARCHTLTEGPAGYPLLTDFGYYNLGIPMNPDNPFYTMPKKWNPDGEDWIDPGLGGFRLPNLPGMAPSSTAPAALRAESGPVKPVPGSWQLAQDCVRLTDRLTSKNIFLPSSMRVGSAGSWAATVPGPCSPARTAREQRIADDVFIGPPANGFFHGDGSEKCHEHGGCCPGRRGDRSHVASIL